MSGEIKPGTRVQKIGTKRRGTVDAVSNGIATIWWDSDTESKEPFDRLTVLDSTPGRKKA